MHDVIAALPDHTVASARMLFAEMRKAGHQFTRQPVRDAVDDLIVAGRLDEVPGKRGAKGYQAVVTASATASEEHPVTASDDRVCASASSIETTRRRRHRQAASESTRRSPTQSDAVVYLQTTNRKDHA